MGVSIRIVRGVLTIELDDVKKVNIKGIKLDKYEPEDKEIPFEEQPLTKIMKAYKPDKKPKKSKGKMV